jgi:hypothetical protein
MSEHETILPEEQREVERIRRLDQQVATAQKQNRDPAAVKRAKRALLFDGIFEQMQAAHHQADLVMLFAEIDDHRGVNRQLTFLVEAVQRAVLSSADLSALKSEGAA